MPADWNKCEVGDFLRFANGKSSPERSNSGIYPVFGSNGTIGFAEESNAPAKTIIIGRVGSYCGSVYFSDKACWVTDNAIRATAADENDAQFIFYFLKWLNLNNWRVGSGQPLLNQSILSSISAVVPMPSEQQAIAAILGALDDKIDLNRRMNETLESMARAIFKSWFVDFDPVRAKMEGKQPFGMDADTAALFPDRLVESELGLIPEGWEITALVDQCQIVMGQSPPGETYNETGIGIPFYQGKRDFNHRFPTRRVHCTAPTRHAISGSTLLSVRAPVGTVNQAWEDCAIGRGLASLMHKSGHTEITYQICIGLQDEFKLYEGEGTVFGSINKSSLCNLQIVSPCDLIVTQFEKTAGKLGACIRANTLQSRTLAELRDLLLPKLLSGEIRVKEAEQMVEAAV